LDSIYKQHFSFKLAILTCVERGLHERFLNCHIWFLKVGKFLFAGNRITCYVLV